MSDPVNRFSSRVENYIKYRPNYPPAVLQLLQNECGLTPDAVIADVGSGTGILSEVFLKHGNQVFGVEPNESMRAAAERLLSQYKNFHSVAASAETTTLVSSSVDFVTAAQAFHWFDHAQAQREFARILKPLGWAVLVWNERRTDSTPFLRDYEELLLRYGTDYKEVRHELAKQAIEGFLAPDVPRFQCFDNVQMFDYESLEGRSRSASYTPEPGHPNFAPLFGGLREIFEKHATGGKVAFEYDTGVYYGHLSVSPSES
jgi:SAM-dependent methyltransferase